MINLELLINLEPHLPLLLYLISLAGFTGMTSVLSIILDVTALLTFHIHVIYLGTKLLFKSQWKLAVSMFRLFQGVH